ncbi:type VI secretion system ATPase TssH [Hydrocarboniclastica marina]|uniref:Type VI secretion system ATPase TssH n=1 Tax=Hydrocarboniclastica marina TaxID=2259620 RepID=A0A4P7XCZ8_9ALTE|nr:type VI secretion system ATPase TssH [Hydrocarboniclastica marina]QCF24738.1 type VI secretion system ATPase TssH [Hydrocarboniclastica marina]
MSAMTLKSLVEKMNDSGRQALERGVGLCFQRSHHSVEVEHFLKALMDEQDADLRALFLRYGISEQKLETELDTAMEAFKTGNGATPSLSPRLVDLLRQCWLDTSIEFGESHMRGATLLFSLLNDPAMAALTTRFAKELEHLDPQRLLSDWAEIRETLGTKAAARTPSPARKEKCLSQFTVDLTAQARESRLDPVLGRDDEIRQVIDILTRRRQNNPILTGEAGVGKTAVVEGLAQRIADGNVPEVLRNARLLTLDLALLQAGAGVKGEFENRLKGVIEEVRDSVVPVILFIDEAHNMVGAGGQAGQNDAANLLKPALARGELRTIAATTWAEYKKFFEKDAALTRRFQVVKVDEPDEETAVRILRGLVPTLETHHKVVITDAAAQAAVRLSMRYLAGRQLPDKAVALLDTAAARVAMSQGSLPAALERVRAAQAALQAEADSLSRESRSGVDHGARQDAVATELHVLGDEITALETAWSEEKHLVETAQELNRKVVEAEGEAANALQQELSDIRMRLLGRTEPMVHWQVTEQLVSEVLSDWTGIPMGRMQSDEIAGILGLHDQLKKRVKGQDHALEDIARTVRIARAELADEKKPLGVFLLVGPSGVGKTETALALAEQVYGSEANITVINMSEFKEEHKVSQLVGSPPGYVGYGEGGVLTEAVRRKPYSVILLDEMEKAHPGVQDIFYQVFDKGMLRDGEGQDVDFKNTLILMTSNAAAETISDLYLDELTAPEPGALKEAIWDDLLKLFKPAFLGRTTVLPYRPLGKAELAEICQLQLGRIGQRCLRHHNVDLEYAGDVIPAVVERCTEASSGARNIQQILQREVLPAMSQQVLECLADEENIKRIRLSLADDLLTVNVDRA